MFKIREARKLAEKIFFMEVEAPRVAKACQPGEFVIVRMDECGEPSALFFRQWVHPQNGWLV